MKIELELESAVMKDVFSLIKKEVQNNFTYSALIGTTSFLFAVCWQFNQFVFLLQGINRKIFLLIIKLLACALYGAGALDLVPIRKIKTCFNGLLLALGLTYISQFLNDMTIRALVVSFIPAAWFTLTYRLKKPKDGVVLSFIKLVIEIILTIAIAGGIQYVIKMFIQGMTIGYYTVVIY